MQCSRSWARASIRVIARYGFMQTPDVPEVLRVLSRERQRQAGAGHDLSTTFFWAASRSSPPPTGRGETTLPPEVARMARWREKLFIVMTRNAQSATAFFSLPPDRVVELGAQIQF